MTSGSVGSRRAARWVRLIARPNEVSTISAPSSCARRATAKAIDASLSTPVTRMRLSLSSMTSSGQRGVLLWRRAGCEIALGGQHLERVAEDRTRLLRCDHRVDEAALRRAVGVVELFLVGVDQLPLRVDAFAGFEGTQSLAVEDLHRGRAAHHRDLRARATRP